MVDENLVILIYRSAAEHKLSWEQVTEELKASMEWTESTILVIGHIWKEEGTSIIDIQQRMLNIGQVCSYHFLHTYTHCLQGDQI